MPSNKKLRSRKKKEQRAHSKKNETRAKVSDEDFEAVVEWASSSGEDNNNLNGKTLAKAAPSVADMLREETLDHKSLARSVAEAVVLRKIKRGDFEGITAPNGTLESAHRFGCKSEDQSMLLIREQATIADNISLAAVDLASGVGTLKKRCWNCERVMRKEKDVAVCSGCEVAAYCGEDCQSLAWTGGGHKRSCLLHKMLFHLFRQEAKAMEFKHAFYEASDRDASIFPVPLNRDVDYGLIEEIGTLEMRMHAGMPFPRMNENDPSMLKFYDNLERVGRGEWWVCGKPLSSPLECGTGGYTSPDKEERNLFLFLCAAMMHTPDDAAAIGRPGAKNMFESLVGAQVPPGASRKAGLGEVRRLTGGKTSMTASRFLEIYTENKQNVNMHTRSDKDGMRLIESKVLQHHYKMIRMYRR